MPRGVKTFEQILGYWNYDRDPLIPLKYSEMFAEFKTDIQQNGQDFILELLTRRIFDSEHTTDMALYPDKNFAIIWENVSFHVRNCCLISIIFSFLSRPSLFSVCSWSTTG
jgi:Zn-dependent M16 (insulinase) family peptidase